MEYMSSGANYNIYIIETVASFQALRNHTHALARNEFHLSASVVRGTHYINDFGFGKADNRYQE